MNLPTKDDAQSAETTSLLSNLAGLILATKQQEKDAKGGLEKLRNQFFAAANEQLRATLAPLDDDPSTMKFSWEIGDKVVTREFATIGAEFLAEQFFKEQPTLSQRCIKVKQVYELDEDEAQQMVDEDPSLLPLFQKYTTEGKRQARLFVRDKKEEE